MSARRSLVFFRCPESVAVAFLLASCTLTSSDWEPSPLSAPPPEEAAETGDVLSPDVEADAGATVTSPACDDGQECQVASPLPLDVTCGDGLLNQDESDMDCGGSCQKACGLGASCRDDGDCESGSYCAPETASCEVPRCTDGLKNGAEVLADCGGGTCAGCPPGSACALAIDCESAVCDAGLCAAATCTDGVKNQNETDLDCGGSCSPCDIGRACLAGANCQSFVCTAGLCAAASCTDGVKNQNETDVDCGGSCDPCDTGLACVVAADCASAVCGALACAPGALLCCQAPSCDDDVANGTEPFVDCGNAACGGCPVGNTCGLSQQCITGLCQGGRCAVPPTCTDNITNGLESDTDCGGPDCPRCRDLSECNGPGDCINNNCDPTGICISCGDATRNGTETDVDCGGADPFCLRCAPGQACGSNSDCATGFCLGGFC
jgi:hypothetical protein